MHYQFSRYDEAWKDYDQAVQNDPKDAENYFKRGNASFQRKNYAEAIKDYDKALELDPEMKVAERNREIARKKLAPGG
jgi:tetratricopeptide (TPR) repeat protein